MDKNTAKRKYKAGEIQIKYDVDNLKLLHYVVGKAVFDSLGYNYTLSSENIPIVNISEITETEEDVFWLGSEMQYFDSQFNEWRDCIIDKDFKYRLKPKADYSAEIEALQKKAEENGMKVVITFEKI